MTVRFKNMDVMMGHALAVALLLAGSPFSTAQAADSTYWREDQGAAMKLARDGNFDDALPVLQRLHKEHPEDADVTRSYLTVLDWSGQDNQVIPLYKTLTEEKQPDYVLLAVGHAYRLLGKPELAADIYRKGLEQYPANADFSTGEIRSLIDAGHLGDAAKAADAALVNAQKSKELNSVVEEARHVYAISEAREGRYTEALQILAELHENYPNDARITRDYLSVEAWSGDNAAALDLYKALPAGQQPDYVYAAAGKAYRDAKQPAEATAVYHEAQVYYPGNRDFQTGEINSLIEAGQNDQAAALATTHLQENANAPEDVKQSLERARQSKVTAQQENAVELARSGKYKEALAILKPLVQQNPTIVSVRQDYIAVLSWSGQDAAAVRAYESFGRGEMPDFALSALAHSYRNIKKFPAALALYKKGHAADPSNEAFTAGIIGCEMDMKHYGEAQKTAEADLRANGNRLTILILASAAADANNKVYEALNYAQRAVASAPNDPAALQAKIHAEQRIGAADAADELAIKNRTALGAREKNEIEGDLGASLVRWGKLEPVSDDQRYKGSDEAISTLDAKIKNGTIQGKPASPEIMRAQFDRIVALRDRFRMQEAIDAYEALRNQGVKVPAYVLGPVGDAYLYLRQPEAARDTYLIALKETPDDFEIRRQLFFAYVECDDYDNAYATIDKLRDDQPMWYYLKGEPERQANANRMMAEIDAGNARLYSGELADASDRLQPIADNAPNDVHSKEALGSLYLTRGWPRAALDEFHLGTRAQDGHDVGTETGAALASLDMRDYASADQQVQVLGKQYPENLDLQRVQRQEDVTNMAELRVNAFYNLAPSGGNVVGGEGYGIDTDLYSAPIDYNWRIFAGTGYAHEDEPNGEGPVAFEHSHAGVEYRDINLVASAAPTYNVYHAHQRAGLEGEGEWTFNDYWTAGGGYESFSADTPLRALNADVTASKFSGNVEWRQSESREIRYDGDVMSFSDGNTRYGNALTYTERLFTTPDWRFDGVVDTSASHNSGNQTSRIYYNPKLDATALAGLRATQTLSRRYETLYEHSLQVTPGGYWQQDYGTRPAWVVTYEQSLHLNDTLELGAGVNYTHQAYDGVQEDNIGFVVNLVERF